MTSERRQALLAYLNAHLTVPKKRILAYSARTCGSAPMPAEPMAECAENASLAERVGHLDESFTQMLLRKIDEQGMTDAQCYKKANIDRKLFSKIRSDVHYRPAKQTAIALAIALELSPSETDELLAKAGFALSRSSKFDVIISFFVENRCYDLAQINEALYEFDQPLLYV